jgi:hypothetical protein
VFDKTENSAKRLKDGHSSVYRLRNQQPCIQAALYSGGILFKLSDQRQRLLIRVSAQFNIRGKRQTHGRPFRPPKDSAAVAIIKLDATHTCRLTTKHARDSRGDRQSDTTGSTTGTTFNLRLQFSQYQRANTHRSKACNVVNMR